jgi:hypothetical protein
MGYEEISSSKSGGNKLEKACGQGKIGYFFAQMLQKYNMRINKNQVNFAEFER